MSRLFKGPKTVKAEKPDDDLERLRARLRKRGGRQSTILSGGGGVRGEAPVFKRKLGGE